MGAFDGLADTKRGGQASKISVAASTLDAEWRSLGKPDLCVVKIDVEGADLLVLKGAEQCIAAQHPPILVEWNVINLRSHGIAADEILGFVRQSNYSLHAVPGLARISTSSELALHMQVTENFLLWPLYENSNAMPKIK
jgi:hypothetical protein